MVHRFILTNSGPFFEAACKPEWIGIDERILRLPDDESEVIEVLIICMCMDKFVIHGDNYVQAPHHLVEASLRSIWGLLAKLYVLGQKYQTPRLCNDSLDALLNHCLSSKTFNLGLVPYVYENTPSGSPLRRFFVRFGRDDLSRDGFEAMKEMLGFEFVCDVASYFIQDRGEQNDIPPLSRTTTIWTTTLLSSRTEKRLTTLKIMLKI